jgi:RimJ/RimL family protein N-acetyltransferase
MSSRVESAGGKPPAARLRIRLRPWQPEEAAWYVAALDDEILRWTRESQTMGPAECAAALGGAADANQRALAVVDAEDGALLGNLGIAVAGGEAELSYWIAAASRGKGVAQAALLAGTEVALQDSRVTSCFLLIHPENEASLRVAGRAGYKFAGTQPGPPDCSGDDGLVAVYRFPSP